MFCGKIARFLSFLATFLAFFLIILIFFLISGTMRARILTSQDIPHMRGDGSVQKVLRELKRENFVLNPKIAEFSVLKSPHRAEKRRESPLPPF